MCNMTNKTWFITGATRGLGFQIAKAALEAGDNVIATGRNIVKLRQEFDCFEKVLCLALDVCNNEQILLAAKSGHNHFGSIDVLVNNAGFGQLGLFEEVEELKVQAQFTTNVFSLMSVTRAILPLMRKQRSGLIYNISSIGGGLGFENASIYCASKFAIEGLSESLALEVKQFGIDVTIVQPGFFRTDFLDPISIKQGSRLIEDYADYSKTLEVAYQAQNHQQQGDPKKLGRLLVEVSNQPKKPLRLAAGTDAVEYLSNANKQRQEELEKWAVFSNKTDIK